MAHRTATVKWSDFIGSAEDLISILDFTEDTPIALLPVSLTSGQEILLFTPL